ncbi:hypothetical protein [Planctobacterium marinum]|uniref:hypothetical protein n=1 Tax=Planctobacterium marinum TaxID=1631968 RepID=UPI001E49916A|nr:hypothetical protein [Planctobacterium marinum]MCC2607756.1 hypothetical protein [Planctobacterium marinum]
MKITENAVNSKSQLTDRLSLHKAMLANIIQHHQSSLFQNSEVLTSKSDAENTFGFKVGCYPILMESSEINEVLVFNDILTSICYKVIAIISEITDSEFRQKYGMFLTELTKCHCDKFSVEDFMGRVDFILSDGQIKLLEINSGSSIGGWELDFIHSTLIQALNNLPNTRNIVLRYHPTLKVLVECIASRIKQLSKSQKTGNIVFHIAGSKDNFSNFIEHHLREIYQACSDYVSGDIYICNNPDELTFTKDNILFFKEKSVDAIIMADYYSQSKKEQAFQDAYLAGNLVYPDNYTNECFGNKLFLALFCEPLIHERLETSEVEWIHRYVPWTMSLKNPIARYQKTTVSLKTLLVENQTRFVLKKGVSLKGNDVYIGNEMSVQNWSRKVNELVGNGEWLMQEYCSADVIEAAMSCGQVKSCIPVWASFNFGTRFGGMFARSIPAQSESYIVNAAQGAILNLVCESKKRISI